MADTIPSHIVSLFRNRKGLLWICQRRDLREGEEPHSYDTSPTDAAVRYRSGPDESDERLSSLYWWAIWSESAKPHLLSAIRKRVSDSVSSFVRNPVMLASNADVEASISAHEFIPFHILPGILDDSAPVDMQYGTLKRRTRERVAWGLASRLRFHPGSALVVIGARTTEDLGFLFELLEEHPFPDTEIFLVQEPSSAALSAPEACTVKVTVWKGSLLELSDALFTAGAPRDGDVPEWAFRIKSGTIQIRDRDVSGVAESFLLITERDLLEPDSFNMDDLRDFLAGSTKTWKGFAAGLPFARSYRSGKDLTLNKELLNVLGELSAANAKPAAHVVELPCQGGAGATTLLRGAAFAVASEGYPAIVMKPDQSDFDQETVLEFMGALSEAALSANLPDLPPCAVFFDVEHSAVMDRSFQQFCQLMVSSGRRIVLIIATNVNDSVSGNSAEEKRSERRVRLRPLTSEIQGMDIELVTDGFRRLVERWHLPVDVPSRRDWQTYQQATQWTSGHGAKTHGTLFWVGLSFVITSGMNLHDPGEIREALGAWITRRTDRIRESRMVQVVDVVAILSAWRIISPLWTVLRPVTGGIFPSELSRALREMDDLIVWGGFNKNIDDQTVYFRHPALAEEYLRQRDAGTWDARVELIGPLLQGLSTGHTGDMWVAETLAFRALTPSFGFRTSADYQWRLNAFEQMPQAIYDQSKTVLHHWSRCLYLSVEPPQGDMLTSDMRKQRFRLAIEKLKRARVLPSRTGRDENPSHLANTLGTAYYRYAKFLEEEGARSVDVEDAWSAAFEAFRDAIDLSGGFNMEAILAFSRRLLDKASVRSVQTQGRVAKENIEYIIEALSLLDRAQDILELHANPDPDWYRDLSLYKSEALQYLNEKEFMDFIDKLLQENDRDTGFYCRAALLSRDRKDLGDLQKAHELLVEAEQRKVPLMWRTLLLWLSILRSHPDHQDDFKRQLGLHELLERAPDFTLRPIDRFRHAVLCYQTGDFKNGAERFRRLRDILRSPDTPKLYVRDFWRDAKHPRRPRETFIRVVKVINEWRAEGFVDELGQNVPVRPRHFTPALVKGKVNGCIIRFEANGPLAVPVRFGGV